MKCWVFRARYFGGCRQGNFRTGRTGGRLKGREREHPCRSHAATEMLLSQSLRDRRRDGLRSLFLSLCVRRQRSGREDQRNGPNVGDPNVPPGERPRAASAVGLPSSRRIGLCFAANRLESTRRQKYESRFLLS